VAKSRRQRWWLQEQFQAAALLDSALTNTESLNMTAVYLAMDSLKRAVVLTRERDIELEAMAEAKLGALFEPPPSPSTHTHTYSPTLRLISPAYSL
jgi:hypothetical protein